MINAEERERREQLRKEEAEATERISGPVKHLFPMPLPTIGREFDMTDQQTRLLCEHTFTSKSCWRTGEGVYVQWIFFNDAGGPGPQVIDTTEAHEMINKRESKYKWYITEDETKELQEDDKRIERKRSLGL
jgi:hypothetical protein